MTAKTKYDGGDLKVQDDGLCKKVVDYITVEPIIFCNFLAFAFFRVAEQAGLYKVICIQNYGHDDASVDCQNLKYRPDIEDKVQEDTSVLNIYISMAYLLPALISDTIMGAWADKSGRKINILIGLCGLIVTLFPYTVLFTFPMTPIWILIVANVFGGLSGYIAIVMISTSAYLTDVVPEKKNLTLRISQLYVFNAASACIGSFSAGALVRATPLPYVVTLAEFILFCGFLYTLFRIKQIPPVIMRKMVVAKRAGATREQLLEFYKKTDESDKSTNEVDDFVKLFVYVKTLYKEVADTFTKPRPGCRRCRLWICCYIFFVFLMTELGLMHGPILGLFVFYRPFYWSPELLGYWKGTQAALFLLGNFFGSWIMKHYLQLKDTTVLLISLSSAVSHLTLMALSDRSWLLYLSITVGMLSNLTLPTLKSIVAQLVEPDEVGKAYTATGITADLAFVTSTLVFNNVYKVTVAYFAGFVFLFAAFLLSLCILAVLWMAYDSYEREKNEEKSGKCDSKNERLSDKQDSVITKF